MFQPKSLENGWTNFQSSTNAANIFSAVTATFSTHQKRLDSYSAANPEIRAEKTDLREYALASLCQHQRNVGANMGQKYQSIVETVGPLPGVERTSTRARGLSAIDPSRT